MNPLPPNDSREALEARITALILGELSSPDAAELEQRIAADPQLVALRHRLQKAANLLREACASAESGAVSSAPAEKLSPTKRDVLLARFKTVNPPVVAPQKKTRLPSWIIPVTLTACVILLAGAMLLPSLVKAKQRAQLLARVGEERLGVTSVEAVPELRTEAPDAGLLLESRRRLSGVAQTTTPTMPASTAPSSDWDEDAGRKVVSLKPKVLFNRAPQDQRLARERAGATSLNSFGLLPAPSQPAAGLDLAKSAESLSRKQVPDSADGLAVNGVARQNAQGPANSPEPGALVEGESVQNYAYLGEQIAGETPSRQLSLGGVYANDFGGFGAKETRDAKEFAETAAASADTPKDWFFKENANGPEQGQTLGYAIGKLETKEGVVALADAEKGVNAGNMSAYYDSLSSFGDSLNESIAEPQEKKARVEERFVGDLTKPIEVAKAENAADKTQIDLLQRGDRLAAPARGTTTRTAGRYNLGLDRGMVLPPQAPVVSTPAISAPTPGGAGVSGGLPAGQVAPPATPAPLELSAGAATFSGGAPAANVHSLDVRGYAEVPSAPAQSRPGVVSAVTGTELALATNSVLASPKAPASESEVLRMKVQADAPAARPPAPAPVPQPEVAAAENPFSTFSLNVSDVSYRLATTALGNGQMPDVSTIRSEEFVNAFDYRDPAPAPDAPVAMTWERARYPFAHNRDLIRIAVKTAGTGRESGRALNLVLLMDNSGSMERADRVAIIREALRVLGTKLQPQDKLTVMTFSRTPMLRIDGLSGAAAVKVLPELEGLTPEGGTNLEEAMRAAYASAMRHYIAGGMNRVVLLTDGAANLGDINPERLRATVEEHRKKGIALDCFGIGFEGYDDQMLEALSRNGDGRYAFINTPEAAATEFAGKLAGALQIAASDVKVQVEFNPARVNVYRQIGYAKHQLTKEQFRDNTVDAAEIAALESGNALYTVELKPDGTGPIGTVRVRYKVPGTGNYHEYEWAMPYTGNAPSLAQSTPALRLAATSAGFAEWLVSSPWAGEITTDALIPLMQGIPQHYAPDARPTRLLEAIRQAKSISGR